MINLDERPEKFNASQIQLNTFGIYPYRFSAVNGWTLSLKTVNAIGVKFNSLTDKKTPATYFTFNKKISAVNEKTNTNGRTYFYKGMTPGAIGIVLSHLSVLYDAYQSDYKTIWVMEDDIEVVKNPNKLSDYIDELDSLVGKDGWDILFTDPDTKNRHGQNVICLSHAQRPNFEPVNPEIFSQRKDISPNFRKIGARYGAYSMILRRSGIKKILRFYQKHKVFLPYDMDFYLPPNIQIYTLREDVVSTKPGSPTDNAYPGYKKHDLN
jgi:GR25 family glycosyltransferase involved in LPS biosynthesis